MPFAAVTMRDIYAARQVISPIITRTPLIHSPRLSDLVGHPVHLKLECQQRTGSFKIRGAANRLLNLTAEEMSRGVITVSTGNHGRAVSYVADLLGIRAVVCMSQQVPANKVEAIKELGAEVVIAGETYDEAEAHALAMQRKEGLTMIEPFDDPLVIAGQGTWAGYEICTGSTRRSSPSRAEGYSAASDWLSRALIPRSTSQGLRWSVVRPWWRACERGASWRSSRRRHWPMPWPAG